MFCAKTVSVHFQKSCVFESEQVRKSLILGTKISTETSGAVSGFSTKQAFRVSTHVPCKNINPKSVKEEPQDDIKFQFIIKSG